MNRNGNPTRTIKGRHAAFTLVELLMVIALIVLLIGLTTGSVGSMGQGHRLTTGGNMTVDLINDARQLASARNTKTMVALVTSGTDSRRLLTTLIYSLDTAGNGGWSQIDQWRRLPEGIEVDQSATIDTNYGEYLFTTPPAATTLKRGGADVQFSAAVFLPDGRPHITTNKAQLAVLKQSTASAQATNSYKIIVNAATGIPVIRRP
jgi:competence protein ComGC